MKNLFCVVLSGILLSVSWPTYGIPFFIFVAFVPLLFVEENISQSDIKRKGWAVFGCSYLTFIIWNIITTGWLYNSQNPDGSPALMAVVFPVLVNSLLMSTAFQLFHWYKKGKKLPLGLTFFVFVWMSFEYFHMAWEFTWPWLNLGNSFADYPQLIQWYDTLGATGGSFWILTLNVLIFYIVKIWWAEKRFLVKISVVVLGLIVLPMMISLFKYHQFDEKPTGKVRVMMLQPNLDPYHEKYQKDSLQIVQELFSLAENSSKIDFYLSPETSFPGYGGLSEKGLHNSQSIHMVESFLKNHPKSVFMGGVSTHKIYNNDEEKPESATFYDRQGFWADSFNSALQIVPEEEIQIYHKGKLVPGVEIFPYMNVLKPILGDAMLNFGGTIASLGTDKERKVFANPYNKGKIAPIICYESIYGEFVTDYVKNGANFLGVITNDSWWGASQGHQQLLAYARLRAIENRREVARSANGGISAHINARGDILAHTLYNEKNALTADVQLYEKETIYSKIGDLLSKISIVMMFSMFILSIFRKIKK